jgi:hypothetical protein
MHWGLRQHADGLACVRIHTVDQGGAPQHEGDAKRIQCAQRIHLRLALVYSLSALVGEEGDPL